MKETIIHRSQFPVQVVLNCLQADTKLRTFTSLTTRPSEYEMDYLDILDKMLVNVYTNTVNR